MAITLRNTKGSALTFAELDGNFSDLDTRVDAKLDSALTTQLIDSAYVQLRVDAGASLDSAEATALIDSAYVTARAPAAISMSKYFFEADSGDTVFTGTDDYGNTLSFDSSNVMVYLNGYLLDENRDFTMTGKNTITTTAGIDSGHALIITTWS